MRITRNKTTLIRLFYVSRETIKAVRYRYISTFGGFIIVVWLLRCIIAHDVSFGFIPTNIFLAAIPLLLEYPFTLSNRYLHGLFKKCTQLLLGVLWLLFLPNAFYIVTDFMHLNSAVLVNKRGNNFHNAVYYNRGDGLYVFDSFILFCATAFGMYVGGIALVHAYLYVRKHFSLRYSLVLSGIVLLLSAIGVYIGRYSRWNSWQGLIHPYRIGSELVSDLADPLKRNRFILVVITILLIEVGSFMYVKYHHS